MRAGRLIAAVGACLAATSALRAQVDWATVRETFAHPPDDCRIMMRWWWFGPAVTKPELQRELEQIKAAGIGGVEIATLYPQTLDDLSAGLYNLPYLSDEYVEDLRFVAQQARRLGLRVDVTLGSGWPLGGPHIAVSQAAGQLRVEPVPVPPGSASVAVPALEAGETLVGSFMLERPPRLQDLNSAREVKTPAVGGRLLLGQPANDQRTVLFFIGSRTGMMVKRPAVGAAGFVLDHYDAQATAMHLQAVGDRLLQAFDGAPPYAVFSDSLEDYGSDWTATLLDEFRHRRGYDLTPYLPALVLDVGAPTAAVRHDWGRTLTELADANFMQPLQTWAHQHHTLLRSQTYGYPPVNLASNRFADLPEGEGKATIQMWREFSDTRWAASAGHLYGHNIISSETWTWLHSPAFRATPLDMKAEADLHFLQGINQLVGHGWPYSPEKTPEPGWRMYAAAALDAHNPWFAVMPELSVYLQRVSYALRLGEPAKDVALLLPEDDVWASFKAQVQQHGPVTSTFGFDESGSNVTMDESIAKLLDPLVIPQILDAGYNLDFIDAETIDAVGIPYKALVLPAIDRLPVATYARVLEYARAGGVVIATGRLPATAPGLLQAKEDTQQIAAFNHALFGAELSTTQLVADARSLGAALGAKLPVDLVLSPGTSSVSFVHRLLQGGDLYFVANTTNQAQHLQLRARSVHGNAELWDAYSGEVSYLGAVRELTLDLEAYGSRIVVFGSSSPASPAEPALAVTRTIDLSHGWKLAFPNLSAVEQASLKSWTEDPRTTYFSGVATYSRDLDLGGNTISSALRVRLDFGKGSPVPVPQPLPRFNMRAYLESPVRDVARVFVNDQLAGSVWHPPYQLEIGSLLKPGPNKLRIEVANTAINTMAGQSIPSYRLLYDRYGTLFVPQDVDHLLPLPSGMLGPVTLYELGPK